MLLMPHCPRMAHPNPEVLPPPTPSLEEVPSQLSPGPRVWPRLGQGSLMADTLLDLWDCSLSSALTACMLSLSLSLGSSLLHTPSFQELNRWTKVTKV